MSERRKNAEESMEEGKFSSCVASPVHTSEHPDSSEPEIGFQVVERRKRRSRAKRPLAKTTDSDASRDSSGEGETGKDSKRVRVHKDQTSSSDTPVPAPRKISSEEENSKKKEKTPPIVTPEKPERGEAVEEDDPVKALSRKALCAFKSIRETCRKQKVAKHVAAAIELQLEEIQSAVWDLASLNTEPVGRVKDLRHSVNFLHELKSTEKVNSVVPAMRRSKMAAAGATRALIGAAVGTSAADASRALIGAPVGTYAAAAALSRTKPSPGTRKIENLVSRKTEVHEIKITPGEGSAISTHDEARKALLRSVDPRVNKIGILSVRKTRDNGLIVETATTRDLEVFAKSEDLRKAELKASLDCRNNPRVIVRRVPKETSQDEVRECLREQNLTVSEKTSVSVCYRAGKRDGDGVNWVVEVDAESRRQLLSRGRVFIGWNSCPVDDYVESSRCYKCQRHGHISRFCVGKEACSHCAKEGHTYEQCPAKEEPPKCVNCSRSRRGDAGHGSNSKVCPFYKASIEWRVARINYG